jgi:hypothetical protein
MTAKALEKINGTHAAYLEKLHNELKHHASEGADKWHDTQAERYGGKIRGYLEALEACGIITHRDVQALYLYYRANI